MTAHWDFQGGRLMSHWSEAEIASKYDSDWTAWGHEGRARTCPLDMSRLSTFGGATWYAHAPVEREQRKASVT